MKKGLRKIKVQAFEMFEKIIWLEPIGKCHHFIGSSDLCFHWDKTRRILTLHCINGKKI